MSIRKTANLLLKPQFIKLPMQRAQKSTKPKQKKWFQAPNSIQTVKTANPAPPHGIKLQLFCKPQKHLKINPKVTPFLPR